MRSQKIAVLLWLYHSNLYQEYIDLLYPLRNDIDLHVGLCSDTYNFVDKIFLDYFPNSNIQYYENCGVDVLPFLYQLQTIKNLGYKHFIKLHSKYSFIGTKKHINWRSVLLHDLLSTNTFYSNVNRIQKNNVNMIGNQSLIMNYEHTNADKIKDLCNILGLNYFNFKNKQFIGGNMFLSKVDIFEPFLSHLNKLKNLLSNEKGKVSDIKEGKYCHSLERLFGYVAGIQKKIGFSYHDAKIILNPNIKNHRLHLVTLYNNDCYILENINIYGTIQNQTDSSIQILWKHTKPAILVDYTLVNHKVLINNAYSTTNI